MAFNTYNATYFTTIIYLNCTYIGVSENPHRKGHFMCAVSEVSEVSVSALVVKREVLEVWEGGG
jgi:hypothetical protein